MYVNYSMHAKRPVFQGYKGSGWSRGGFWGEKLCETRWSSRYDSVKAVKSTYCVIKNA